MHIMPQLLALASLHSIKMFLRQQSQFPRMMSGTFCAAEKHLVPTKNTTSLMYVTSLSIDMTNTLKVPYDTKVIKCFVAIICVPGLSVNCVMSQRTLLTPSGL